VAHGRPDQFDSPTGDAVANNDSPPGPATGPVLLWLLVQLAALSLAALRIPLAAKYPQPAELLATHVMLVAQVAAAALLFPRLMPDWRTAAGVIVTAWPFAVAASALSAASVGATARGEAYVTAWLVALALWSAALPGPRSRLYGVSVAASLSMGAAILWYLAHEFGVAGGPERTVGGSGRRLWAASPVLAALNQVSARGPLWGDAVFLLALVLAAVATVLARRRRDRLSTARARPGSAERPITS
jgi:hypothetical protein